MLKSIAPAIASLLFGYVLALGMERFGSSMSTAIGYWLWAAVAWLGFALFRDIAHAGLVAILTPVGVLNAWWEYIRIPVMGIDEGALRLTSFAVLFLSLVYLAARRGSEGSPARRGLGMVGTFSLFPALLWVLVATSDSQWYGGLLTKLQQGLFWGVAWTGCMGLAFALRGREVWKLLLAGVWVLMLGFAGMWPAAQLAWCGVGAWGLATWGVWEGRRERVRMAFVMSFLLVVVGGFLGGFLGATGPGLGIGLLGAVVGGWALIANRHRLRNLLPGPKVIGADL